MRIESSLRRLDGVRSVQSDFVAGTVTIDWRPAVPLAIDRLKQAISGWRGGVRYGSAVVAVVGDIDPGSPLSGSAAARLSARETGQGFWLTVRPNGPRLAGLRPDAPYRVTGRVIKSGKGNHEIWLELEQIEPASPDAGPGTR